MFQFFFFSEFGVDFDDKINFFLLIFFNGDNDADKSELNMSDSKILSIYKIKMKLTIKIKKI